MTRLPMSYMAEEYVDACLKGRRYPRIERISIIQHTCRPSAVVKIRRRFLPTGGPSITRIYFIYNLHTLNRWQQAQCVLFGLALAQLPKGAS